MMRRIVLFLTLVLTLFSGAAWAQVNLLVVPNEAHGTNYVERPVLCFRFEGTGPLQPLPSIPANLVGLVPYAAFNAEGELFLTNRQDPTNGSISRFKFDENLNYVSNGTITDLCGDTHGLAFNGSGELFTVNTYSGIISRFVFGADGIAISNGLIIPDQTRPSNNSHGLAFSQNGELFITHPYTSLGIHRYLIDPSTGAATFNGQFIISGANWNCGLTFNSNGELFVADQYTYRVWRYKFLNGNPVSNGSILLEPKGDAIGVAFSPEGELFVTCAWSGGIYRFLFDENGNAIPHGYTPTVHLGGPAIASMYVAPANQSPVSDAGPCQNVEQTGIDGAQVILDGSASYDPDGDPLSYSWTWNGGSAIGVGPTITLPPGTTTVTLVVNDGIVDSQPDTVDITVEDTIPPEISVIEPIPYGLYPSGGLVLDFGATDSGSGVFDCWGTLTDSYGYSGDVDSGFTPEAGVYNLVVKAIDFAGNDTVSDSVLFVVYNPEGGFVTGGGWIWSEPGAYVPDETLEGKASFGFVSKYKKGASVPTGNTEFVFQAGDLNFHSSSYDWLVVTGSNYARFKGWGSINGGGNYQFMLWAGDKEPDTFRIKIWWEDDEVENVVYDNGMDQPIEGGSIIIHTK